MLEKMMLMVMVMMMRRMTTMMMMIMIVKPPDKTEFEIRIDCLPFSPFFTNVFVELWPHVNVSRLDCREDQLRHT